MAGIDFEAIRGRFRIEMPVISGLESSIAHVAASYGSLAEPLREISDITRLPAFVLPGATREIYTTSFAFTNVLRENGIRISMDGRGRWLDYVFIELLWH